MILPRTKVPLKMKAAMFKPANRRKARKLALQAMYQYQFTKDAANDLIIQRLKTVNPKKVDIDYFVELLGGIVNNLSDIDAKMQEGLDRKITELNVVELAVLRIALYELIYKLEIPYRVVINEALELEKDFGSADGHKYVNAVLDKLAYKIRPAEVAAKK